MNHTKSRSFYLWLSFILLVGVLSCKQHSGKQYANNQYSHKKIAHNPQTRLVSYINANVSYDYHYDSSGRIQSYVSTWLDKEFAFHIDSTTYKYDEESGHILKSIEYRSYGYMSRTGHLGHLDTLQAKFIYDQAGKLLEERDNYNTIRYSYKNNMLICKERYNNRVTGIDSFKYDMRGNIIRKITYVYDPNPRKPIIITETRHYDTRTSYFLALPEAFRQINQMTDSNNCTKICFGDPPCITYAFKYNAEGYPRSAKVKGVFMPIVKQDSVWFKYATF